MPNKYVFYFGGNKAEGKAEMKNLLGGKGANLAEMVNIGLPVPPGFTISTEVCTYYYDNRQDLPQVARGRGPDGHGQGRESHGLQVRRPEEPAARLGPLRGPGLDARHDGHHPEPGPERHARSRG